MTPLVAELKEKLAPVFEKRRDQVAAVYLFGSLAKGDAGPNSDVDLAVLLQDRSVLGNLDFMLDFHVDCCRALKRNDIDLIVLNRTSNLYLLDDVVSNGVVLIDANPVVRQEFEVKVHHDFIDFRDHRIRTMGV